MITGRELINGYYEDTKLYSTGDSDLDDLLEKAFCEGYEYAQREFVKAAEKEAKMQLAREILEAEEAGDTRIARELKSRFVKKDRKLAKGIGMMAGSALGGMTGLAAGSATESDAATVGLGALGTGAGLGIGAGIGHNIGRHISNDRLDKYMKAAKKEKEEKKNNKEK